MRRKYTDESVKFFTSNDLAALFAVIGNARDLAMALMSYTHGLRASEVGLIRLSDINLREKSVYIRRLKGSISGSAPLLPVEFRAIKQWLRVRGKTPGPLFISRQHRPISRHRLDDLVKGWGKLAGVDPERCHWHAFRHATGTALAATEPLQQISWWMGHKSFRSSQWYLHQSLANLQAMGKRLEGFDFGRPVRG